MAPRVTVIVPPIAATSRLLLLSLDRQTLPASAYEVLVGDDGQDPGLSTRLEDLGQHRPNLRWLPVAPDADGAVSALLAHAEGEYVVVVPPQRRLNPHALENLLTRADATGADVVAGLTGRAGQRPATLANGGDAPTAGRLRRRLGVDAARLAADLRGDPCDDGATPTSPVCFVDGTFGGRKLPAGSDAPGARVVSVRWREGAVEVVATVAEADGDPQVSVYSPRLGVDWPVPATARPAEDGLELSFRIDPELVPGYGPLQDGLWWPSVRTGPGPETALLLEITAADARGAALRGRTVVSFAEAGRLGLDVGAGSHQPIDHLDPAATTVVEDARGSLLTSLLTYVDIADGAGVDGLLRLGDMPVTARIERVDPEGAVLRAWVSGLAGSAALATSFAKAPYASTGTHLVVDGVGAMTVTAEPAPDPDHDHPDGGVAGRALRRVARSVSR